jgi:hypothetical protein
VKRSELEIVALPRRTCHRARTCRRGELARLQVLVVRAPDARDPEPADGDVLFALA